MPIPQSFLEELKSRISIAEVVGRRVSFDQRKSRQGKGDLWACCPFHGEKTPSFHVVEDQGYYHCFGCGEKGGAIDFLMKIDNLAFREAVELLAADAGMTMPDPDPRQAKREERSAALTEVMDEAARFFAGSLRAPEGRDAAAYLARRGVSPEMIERFRLGYAPDARDALTRHLRGFGAREEDLVQIDLASRPDRGGAPYDRFRNRLMFPIEDARGRVIAFGGRALSPDQQAKYLNSRETPLFSKGKVLYNFRRARSAAREAPLIVVEGYMDVIALAGAGFDAAVAPLGTALTEDQLALLWKVAPEPVMALDGDEAGLRAARRAADMAIDRLAPGRSLHFALLPDGQDPDDLIKARGREAMRAEIEAALPLIELVWRREKDATPLDTPERKAALEARLGEIEGRIPDETVRRHYHFAFRERRFELFRAAGRKDRQAKGDWNKGDWKPKSGGGKRGGGWSQPKWAMAAPAAETLANPLSSKLAKSDGAPAETDLNADGEIAGLHPLQQRRWRAKTGAARLCESMLIAALLRHPWLVERYQQQLDALEFFDRRLDSIRIAILSAVVMIEEAGEETSAERFRIMVESRVGTDAVSALMAEGDARLPKPLTKLAQTDDAETSFLGLLDSYATNAARILEGKDYAAELSSQSEDERPWRLGKAIGDGAQGRATAAGDTEDGRELSQKLADFVRQVTDNGGKPAKRGAEAEARAGEDDAAPAGD